MPWVGDEGGTEGVSEIPVLVVRWQVLRIPEENVKTQAMRQISVVDLSKEFLKIFSFKFFPSISPRQ